VRSRYLSCGIFASFAWFAVEEESKSLHGQETCPSYPLVPSACIGVHRRLRKAFGWTSSNLVLLCSVSHADQKNYVSRRDAGTQGGKDDCGSLASAPPRLCARGFWLRPKAAPSPLPFQIPGNHRLNPCVPGGSRRAHISRPNVDFYAT
jgi:hypothetical protein